MGKYDWRVPSFNRNWTIITDQPTKKVQELFGVGLGTCYKDPVDVE